MNQTIHFQGSNRKVYFVLTLFFMILLVLGITLLISPGAVIEDQNAIATLAFEGTSIPREAKRIMSEAEWEDVWHHSWEYENEYIQIEGYNAGYALYPQTFSCPAGLPEWFLAYSPYSPIPDQNKHLYVYIKNDFNRIVESNVDKKITLWGWVHLFDHEVYTHCLGGWPSPAFYIEAVKMRILNP